MPGVIVVAAASTAATASSATSIASAVGSRRSFPTRRATLPPAIAPSDVRAERGERRRDRQRGAAGDAEAEQDDVAGHVRGEDAPEPEEAHGVDDPRRERENEQRLRQRMPEARGRGATALISATFGGESRTPATTMRTP